MAFWCVWGSYQSLILFCISCYISKMLRGPQYDSDRGASICGQIVEPFHKNPPPPLYCFISIKHMLSKFCEAIHTQESRGNDEICLFLFLHIFCKVKSTESISSDFNKFSRFRMEIQTSTHFLKNTSRG